VWVRRAMDLDKRVSARRLAQQILITLAVIMLAGEVVPTTADPDLWIWRDRWNVMGRAFQDGYVTGVVDAVMHLGKVGNSADVARWAHTGIADRFPTIQSAVEWADAGVAKTSDPLQIVADMIITRLIRHGNGYDEDEIQSSPPFLHDGFIWKDRWARYYSDVLVGKFFCDGYVTGAFDIIRSLDNAGKSPTVLKADIGRAAGMVERLAVRAHNKNPNLYSVLQAIRPRLALSQDPTENMAMVIFEAMRRY
jgi:hypothetical protein